MKTTSLFKPQSFLATALTVLAALLAQLTITPAHAASLYWVGGSVSWDTTNARWGTVAAGPFTNVWNNTTHAAYIANLQSASPSPSATLGANITCGGITVGYGGSGTTIGAGSGPYTLTLGVNGNNTFSPFANATTARFLTLNPAIAGASGYNFVLAGGNLTLNGVNTFAGSITITSTNGTAPAGNLTIGSSGSLGSGSYAGAISIGAGCNLIYSSSANQILSGAVSGTITSKLTKNTSSTSTLTLSGTGDNAGLALTVSANSGTVVLGKTSTTGVHAFGYPSSVGSGATIQLGGTGDYQIYGAATLTVSSGGVLDLNGRNQNNNALAGVLNLNGTGISSGGALINSLAASTSTLTLGTGSIALQSDSSIGGDGDITVASGAISGTGFALTKVGGGTLTLSGANGYTGATTISGGTLKLSGSGTLATTSISIAGGATFDVSTQTIPTLAASQNLLGTGAVNGNLTTVATTAIYPATDGTAGTLTFNNNLTLDASTQVQLDLSHTYNGANDQIVLSGNGVVLTPNGAQITIKSDGTLDTSVSDYVLINLTGSGSPSISGSFNATPAWAGTTPANSANYTIVTSGTQVTLHYTGSGSPAGVGLATPASRTHGQTTLLTVTVTPGTSPTSTGLAVTADLSSIGGSATQTLYDDNTHGDATAGDNIFSYTATVAAGTSLGGKSLPVTITDLESRTGSANIALTVTAASETWGASPADANWGTAGNWVSGISPAAGDLVYFDTSSQLSPNLETGYSVDSVTFNSGAGSYTIGGSTLTLTGGGVINNSTSAQTLNVPVAMGASQTINAASGDVTLGGIVAGSGKSLTKVGGSALTLSAANSYDSGTTLSAGTLIANNATTPLGTSASALHLNGGTLDLQTIGTAYNTTVGGATTVQSDNASSGPGTTKTLGTLGIGALQLNVAPGLNVASGTAGLTFGATTLTGAAMFDVAANSSLSLGAVGGAFGFTKQNSGTLVLTDSANTFGTGTAGLTLAAGIVQIGSGANYSSGNTTGVLLTINGGTLDLNGNTIQTGNLNGSGGTILNNATATTATLVIGGNNVTGGNYQGVIADNTSGTGTVALQKVGSGTSTLSGANTFSGTTTISGGTVSLGNVAALSGTTGITMATGTTLNPTISSVTVPAPITTAGTVKINAPGSNPGNQAFNEFFVNGAIGGSGNVTFNSTVNVNGIYTVTLGAQSTYSGSTLLDTSGGTASQIIVRLGANNALPTTTVVTIDGQTGAGSGRCAEINLNGYNQTLAGLTNITRSLRVQRVVNSDVSAAATLTINNSANYTFSGALGVSSGSYSVSSSTMPGSTHGNNFGLTKDGSGTFTISGAHTYTGNTTVNNGTLTITTATIATKSTVAVASGAVLQLDFATTNVIGALVLNGVAQTNGIYNSTTGAPYITGSGSLEVVATGPSGPATLTNSVSGGVLSLSWPAGQGWRLQEQTNSLSVGISTNWTYLTDSSVSSTNLAVDITKPTVFYRLVYP